MIPEKCFQELENFDDIVVGISGGTQSTAIAIALAEQGVEFRGYFFDTGLETKTTHATIEKLVDRYGFPLEVHRPDTPVAEAIKQGFEAIEKSYRKEVMDHDDFVCCRLLKKVPAKKIQFRGNSINLIGFTRYDGTNRRKWLYDLEQKVGRCEGNKYDYCHYAKTYKHWRCYPLRDIDRVVVVRAYLDENGFKDTISSGCRICPIILMRKMIKKDPKCYVASKKYYLKHFRGQSFCGEINMPLEEFGFKV